MKPLISIVAVWASACSLTIDIDKLIEGRGGDASVRDASTPDAGIDSGIDPCLDGIPNGDETGVDCGGSCGTCSLFAFCAADEDCESGNCHDGYCRKVCDDGVLNGDESDVDCGGSCPPCGVYYHCNADTDCASTYCHQPDQFCYCPFGADPGPIGMAVVTAQQRTYCVNYTETTRGSYSLYLEHVSRRTNDPRTIIRRSCRALLSPPAVTAGKELLPPLFLQPSPETAGIPVTYVSYCQAKTYCEFYGQRLCGELDGRPLDDGFTGDQTAGQWYRACSEDGLRDYPYVRGSTVTAYNPMACNGVDLGYFTTLHGGSLFDTCVGGAEYLWDMSGNVWEWEDECENGNCRLRGGSYLSDAANLACSAAALVPPNTQVIDIGFRCCSSAPAY